MPDAESMADARQGSWISPYKGYGRVVVHVQQRDLLPFALQEHNDLRPHKAVNFYNLGEPSSRQSCLEGSMRREHLGTAWSLAD